MNAIWRSEIGADQLTLQEREGVRTYLIYFINNILGVTPCVANGDAGHNRKPRLEFVPKEGHAYKLFAGCNIDRVDQAFVVARVNQGLEVGAGD